MIGIGIGVDRRPPSSGGASFDVDAQAFFDRVTAAGGTLSATEQTAVNTLVIDMKSAGIWTPMKAIYPMVGASAAACAQNLKSSSFTGTFTSGWTFASTGVTPNGTSAYFDTLITNTTLIMTNCSWGFYSRTNSDALQSDIGLGAAEVLTRLGNVLYCDMPDSANRLTPSNTDSLGFYSMCNDSTNGYKIYKNGSSISSNSFVNRTFQSGYNMLLSAYQEGGVIARYSNRQLAFGYASNGINTTEASDFYTAVQTFQTTLSRQV
jgi:hypothetical protein